jgi:predicted membrane protein
LVNEWDIQLSNDLPLNLTVRTGAGKSDLALNALDLNQLKVETGAGVTNVDLNGAWQHDLNVSIQGGVGELTVKLPSEMGVRVNMDTALVGVTANNLTKDDQGYVNQAYGTAPHMLTLDLQSGVGAVTLEVPEN